MPPDENPLGFTAEEQKYFDTEGEEGPQVDEETGDAVEQTDGEPAAAAEPGAKAEGEKAPPEAKDAPRVPISEVQAERRKRQEAERAMALWQGRFEALQPRMDLLMQRLGNPQQQERADEGQKIPEWDENPQGHVQGSMAQLLQRLERIEQGQQQITGATQQEQVAQALDAHYAQAAEAFSAEQPALNDGVGFLIQQRRGELAALGVPTQHIDGAIKQEMTVFLAQCAQQQVNPAERAWNWALARGFRPTEKVAEAKANGAAAPNGAANGASDGKQAGRTAKQEVKAISEGQKAAKSLGQASGGAGGEITLEMLADMPADEFDKLTSGKDGEKLWRRLNGG